jgi:alpha-galactosidase
MALINIEENGLHIALNVNEHGDVRLLHFSALPFDPATINGEKHEQWFRLIQLQVTGEDQDDHHGVKHTGTQPGKRLRYVGIHDGRNEAGRLVEIELSDPVLKLAVVCHWQFYDGVPVIRAWTSVENRGEAAVGLEYVSSFALTGLAKESGLAWDKSMRLNVLHNAWEGECQWRSNTLPELGMSRVHTFSLKRLAYSNTSTWSTSQHIPYACLENTETGSSLIWQIEHNGSWHWELSDIREQLYLLLSGPTEVENQWWKRLHPGETFTSVPVAVGAVEGDFQEAIRAMTRYRRRTFTGGDKVRRMPIVFNDYMNSLFGDPTTEKELPLIAAAGALGCETYVIDAGWYADDGTWWDQVGDWQPSLKRFPGGIGEVLDAIRVQGMTPGMWLEIEVMGINNPRAASLPDEWFFRRHGIRVIDHGRYQLDFRHPDVVKFADGVVDRLVREYGVGYINIDYNINAGAGTEIDADSFGDGLLQHNRAYLRWLDGVLVRHPDLWIENCASGGMRMDYAMLSRLPIQSASDQVNYHRFAVIAAAMPSAVTPEQCACWSYPPPDGDAEAVIFNMVNTLMVRVQVSGQANQFPAEMRRLVQAGLDTYKTMRDDIPNSLPYWALGLPTFQSEWTSLALRCGDKTYLAVWRLDSERAAETLKLPYLDAAAVTCIYPPEPNCAWAWMDDALQVTLPQTWCARIFKVEALA